MKKIVVCLVVGLLSQALPAMTNKISTIDYKLTTCNFHEVVEGKVYRCAQLNMELLETVVKTFGIKSILNLRTYGKKDKTKEKERKLARDLEVEYHHVPLRSSRQMMPRSKKLLFECLDKIKENLPVLIHCQYGKNRTSLATAALLKRNFGYSNENALLQFDSKTYGFKEKFAWMRGFVLNLVSKKQKA